MTVLMFFANLGLNVWFSRLYGFWGVAYAQSAGRVIQFLLLVCKGLHLLDPLSSLPPPSPSHPNSDAGTPHSDLQSLLGIA